MKIKFLLFSLFILLLISTAYADGSYQNLKNDQVFYFYLDTEPRLPIVIGNGPPSLFIKEKANNPIADPNHKQETKSRLLIPPTYSIDPKGFIGSSEEKSSTKDEKKSSTKDMVIGKNDGAALDEIDKLEYHDRENYDEQRGGEEGTDLGGLYLELGAGYEPCFNLGAEIGAFIYPTKDFSLKGGLALFRSGGANDLFVGLDLGASSHILGKIPVSYSIEISPYAGAGGFLGYSKEKVLADDDNIDNDEDGDIDEQGEEEDTVDGTIAAMYPEIGVHFWFYHQARVTFSAKYHVTTEGRRYDFWMYCWTIALLAD